MTNIEMSYMNVVPSTLREIARQLKIANELKALEIKIGNKEFIPEVDEIMSKKD